MAGRPLRRARENGKVELISQMVQASEGRWIMPVSQFPPGAVAVWAEQALKNYMNGQPADNPDEEIFYDILRGMGVQKPSRAERWQPPLRRH